jgi:hypothetical protein
MVHYSDLFLGLILEFIKAIGGLKAGVVEV